MVLYTIVQSVSWLGMKKMYILIPGLIGLELYVIRSFIALITVYLKVNKRLKYVMYDSIPSD